MNERTQPNSIPVIRLWDNLLVALQGDLGDAQAERLRTELLDRIRRTGAEGLILDVSGVTVIDSHLCSVLAGITEAAALMGVESMLCGLSPEIVMTLQAMGIDFGSVETALSLEDALEALGIGPLGVVADGDETQREALGVRDTRHDGGSA
ncbi:MAG: STAS domain-containing protein [Myxococcota bacterium]